MYTCPTCGRTSAHPKDAQERFCAVCGFEDPYAIKLSIETTPGPRTLRKDPALGAPYQTGHTKT